MVNLFNSYKQNHVLREDYFSLLKRYAASHRRVKPDGTVVRWRDENLDPFTGEWISRTLLEKWGWRPDKGGRERGKDYNHSTFCDLIITGLAGLRPRADDSIVVNTLVPEGLWDYFCLDNIDYHGKKLTILYDKDGSRYHMGKGLLVFINCHAVAYSRTPILNNQESGK
jgi:hypothetical protein